MPVRWLGVRRHSDTMPPMSLLTFVDTHCHLTNQRFASDVAEVIAAANAAGVARMMTIGTGIEDAKQGLALKQQYPQQIFCAAGLDPFSCHEAGAHFSQALSELDQLLASKQFNALGEIGLEYFHPLHDHATQISQFEAQLALAVQHNLPVVIHSRDAHHDVRTVLKNNPNNRGVIHSFTGTVDDARAFLDLGWHLSFNGMVSFKANDALRAAAAFVPNDRLLIETDAPYLAPMPHRGRRCEPAFVTLTATLIAEQRGQRVEDIAAWTTKNARELLGI
jgi:TatD DNase family protein